MLGNNQPPIVTKEEDDGAVYDDSYIDNDDDLENTPDNIEWKSNKRQIKLLYTNKGISQELINYGNNLILFYEKKISAVKDLIERKSSDGKKNFVGDVTIQDEQRKTIGQMLWNDPSTKNMTEDEKFDLISGYYTEIGSQAEEIMEKDYNDRNRTIKYLLLIREYETNIESIREAISINGSMQDVSDDFELGTELEDTDYIVWGGGSKKIMRGGANPQMRDSYRLLVEQYKNSINSPINDPELKIYLIQYLDNLQFLINDPVNSDIIQFKDICQQLLDRVNFLKISQNIGQNNNIMRGGATPEEIDTFVNSNNLNELDNMINSGKIQNVDEKGSTGMNAFEKAQADANWNKILYLISKDADINQKIRTRQTLLERFLYNHDEDYTNYINQLLYLGASKDGIVLNDIKNNKNRTAFFNINPSAEDITSTKEKLVQYINGLLHPEASSLHPVIESKLDINNPKNPLHAQLELVKDAAKKRDANFNELSEQFQKLVNDSMSAADKIIQIKNGDSEEAKKYNDQKEEIQNLAIAQLGAVEAQTGACINAFIEQTKNLQENILTIQKLASDILSNIQKEEEKYESLNKDNENLDNENKSNELLLGDADDQIDDILEDILNTKIVITNTNIKRETPHEMFVRKYIMTNYLKKNLYEFINQCRLLDSVPSWRAKITTLMVGYLTSYVVDPNDETKHISVIPSYDYFNLVLQGTPGVGKSYSSAIIGKALKWCGFLTVGKMKEIKKPDIVGSYTGQTAPKVYNELTQGLGNVVFIDEAYSIAGARDEVKGTFNEFGQEALDAITDYTSEHIGLLAFIVAGYEYEMQNQFLNVNIGLPRRFPTILTLRRYDMKSFWKILETPVIKFCPKYQVDHHHHACFELLNIMFNFQWTPNPVLQISKKWSTWWEGFNLKNLIMNLKINMASNGSNIVNIPFSQLPNFDEKIQNIENENITAESIEVIPLTKLIGGDINMETATFLKAFFIYKFCNIRNGDFFRSQADNLTKFGQTILSDKIINPSGLFKSGEDNNSNGNRDWIEYVYFNLYFAKNPNKNVENISFSFNDPQTLQVAGSKKRQYTRKNKKSKKYTRRNNGKRNKKTIHKYKYKKNRKTIRQRGGELNEDELKFMDYGKDPNTTDTQREEYALSLDNLSKYIKAQPYKTDIVKKISQLVNDKLNNLKTKPNDYPFLFNDDTGRFQRAIDNLEIIKNLIDGKPDIPSTSSSPIVSSSTLSASSSTPIVTPPAPPNSPNISSIEIAPVIPDLKNINKDLVFDIKGIDFSAFRDAQEITETIVRNKILDNEINKKEASNEKLKTIFKPFMEKYNEYLTIFETNNQENMNQKQIADLPIFIYTYLLLACYNTAFIESKKPLTKFNNDSWWFFTADDFKIIANYLDIEVIIEKFNIMIEQPALVEPVVEGQGPALLEQPQ